ncbi:MAG TPA: hypothetical protein PKA39_11860 [Ignavibacteria bacterium]|nr:hypothetical protein [Ignavibacteria bacterium]
MKIKNKKTKDILEEKFRKGSKLAIKKLIEERKKTDDFLIVSRNGKVVKVKARSL